MSVAPASAGMKFSRVVVEQCSSISGLLLLSHELGDISEEKIILLLWCMHGHTLEAMLPPFQFVDWRLCLIGGA